MKKYFLLLFIYIATISAQVNTIEEALKFFPLNIGDYWEYETFRYPLSDTPDTSWRFSREVVGDTTVSGEKYYIVETNRLTSSASYTKLYRVDSTTGGLYEGDFRIDSLLAQVGDTIRNGFILADLQEKNILGENRLKRIIDQYAITSGSSEMWELTKGLGETYRFLSDEVFRMAWYRTYIVFAKINGEEFGTKTNVNDQQSVHNIFSLSQNYPNPFNPSTTIKFTIPNVETQHAVSLRVYDLLGREVNTLVNKKLSPGSYEVEFDGSELTSGVYFDVLENGEMRLSRKMVLVK